MYENQNAVSSASRWANGEPGSNARDVTVLLVSLSFSVKYHREGTTGTRRASGSDRVRSAGACQRSGVVRARGS